MFFPSTYARSKPILTRFILSTATLSTRIIFLYFSVNYHLRIFENLCILIPWIFLSQTTKQIRFLASYTLGCYVFTFSVTGVLVRLWFHCIYLFSPPILLPRVRIFPLDSNFFCLSHSLSSPVITLLNATDLTPIRFNFPLFIWCKTLSYFYSLHFLIPSVISAFARRIRSLWKIPALNSHSDSQAFHLICSGFFSPLVYQTLLSLLTSVNDCCPTALLQHRR